MVKVGILGTGFGKEHAKIYQKMDNVQIVSIFGRNPDKLKEIESNFSTTFTDKIEDILTDKTIDLVDICLPTSNHQEYVIKALENGKHVFCETPISYSLSEIEQMKQAARTYHKQVFVDLFIKYSDPHRYAIEKAKDQSLGKIISVNGYQRTPPNWGDMSIRQLVCDMMIHNLDFVSELLGVPNEVNAKGLETKNSQVYATLIYKDALAMVEATSLLHRTAPFQIGFTVIFEKGSIHFTGEYGEQIHEKMDLFTPEKATKIEIPGRNEYEVLIREVIKSVEKDTSLPSLSLESAGKAMSIADAIMGCNPSK
ncbi:MAG TPA: Gfo/Idh/MocA family oxidoreductase [Thermotogota bacterium]|nr:Gfo/Idh/MocA family oxidoreductase [Thermotogota bacterium]HRW35300.1 Gfo/Idh/MocA family oxidoreductase [Thermotogota bacterium]